MVTKCARRVCIAVSFGVGVAGEHVSLPNAQKLIGAMNKISPVLKM